MSSKASQARRTALQAPSALISGASFAGLASAWWLHRLGYAVTVVEVAPAIRKGGTPVDIREGVVEVVRRMGLLDRIVGSSLPPRPMDFLDAAGAHLARMPADARNAPGTEGWEIERDTLLDMLYDEVRGDVEFLFSNSVTALEQTHDEVRVTLASGEQRTVSLLLGCDGTHSAVRRLCFGDESAFNLFLGNYFSLTIVDELLLPEDTAQMFNLPGRAIMLSAYNGKTDIAFCFSSQEEISYDRRDRGLQKQIIHDHFAALGWRAGELLGKMHRSDNFYFDKLCQIRMPAWTSGRVALVGDAGYCPSPAAGMGGSMALLGAAALADALAKHPYDLPTALKDYDRTLRPVVEAIQTEAAESGLKIFIPATEADIRERNAFLQMA